MNNKVKFILIYVAGIVTGIVLLFVVGFFINNFGRCSLMFCIRYAYLIRYRFLYSNALFLLNS